MTISDILCVMGEAGAYFVREALPEAFTYVRRMVIDGRCITIKDDNGKDVGVIFFSVCDDYDPFYKKKRWHYLPHNPDGKILYVELIASSIWNKQIRIAFQEGILNRFPNLKTGVWHRWAKWGDRRVVSKERGLHVSHTHSNK